MTGEQQLKACVSCGVPSVCVERWPSELVPLPDNIVDGLICDDCHASLLRYAGVILPIMEAGQ